MVLTLVILTLSIVQHAAAAALPDDPCGLLTAEEMAAAVGLPVTSAQPYVPSPGEGKPPGGMCTYETGTEHGSIFTVIASGDHRNRAWYWSGRHASFEHHRDLVEFVPSLGKDAWIASGVHLHVLLRDNGDHFSVSAPTKTSRTREILLRSARAVVEKFQ